NGIVRINWGTNDGITEGVILNVYREDIVYHSATGEQLTSTEKLIGKLEINQTQADYSIASVRMSDQSFRVGDIIKISYDEMAEDPAVRMSQDMGTIQSIEDLIVTFNLGRQDGVEINQYFDVFRDIGPSAHPVTGIAISAKTIYIGRLIVISVDQNTSKARIAQRERDVNIGDRIELSPLQASDIMMMEETPEEAMMQRELPAEMTTTQSEVTKPLTPPDKIVGTVTRVSGRDIYFLWRSNYGFDVGRVFAIYRRIDIEHPETGIIIDNPLIQVGTATLSESIGKLGKAFISSSDDDIIMNDYLGLSEGEMVSSNQVIGPQNIEQVYNVQRSDILGIAEDLTNQIVQMRTELDGVKETISKISSIEANLAAQRAMNVQNRETLRTIQAMLEGNYPEGYSLSESGASMELSEVPLRGTNVVKFEYPKDIDIDFQSLSQIITALMTSEGADLSTIAQSLSSSQQQVTQMTSQPGDTTLGANTQITSGDDTVEGESGFWGSLFDIKMLSIIIGSLAVVAGGLYFLLFMKKKSPSSPVAEEGEDDELVEEDDFEDADEEIIPEDEEIESFEE
ncbi:hypothetical protein ACFL7D_10565, partial [candidate division KSB1 bacterium]